MQDFADREQLFHVLLLVLPVAVFATLVMLLVKSAKKKKSKRTAVRNGSDGELLLAMLSEPQAVAQAVDPHAALTLKLRAAEADGDNAVLAPIYLELAHALRAAGRESDSLRALRSAAGIASKFGPRAAHADARLQLAEVAFKAGDLTSACEHWQMAKTALHDDGQREAQARVEKQMKDQGCPTDWVLTDF